MSLSVDHMYHLWYDGMLVWWYGTYMVVCFMVVWYGIWWYGMVYGGMVYGGMVYGGMVYGGMFMIPWSYHYRI